VLKLTNKVEFPEHLFIVAKIIQFTLTCTI